MTALTRLHLRALVICAASLYGMAALAQDRAAIEAGEELYEEHCAKCHGDKLRSTGAMPDLREQKADGRAKFDQMMMTGRNQMPSWQGIISPEELDKLWAYIRSRASDR